MHFDARNYESASWALDHENKTVGILVTVPIVYLATDDGSESSVDIASLNEIGSTQEKKIAVGCVAHNLRYAA